MDGWMEGGREGGRETDRIRSGLDEHFVESVRGSCVRVLSL